MLREVDLERVRANVQQATTPDLLERATAYREGMEPEALAIIEEELHRRGVSEEEVRAAAERWQRQGMPVGDGTVQSCSFCPRPAVAAGWIWRRVFLVLPLVPVRVRYCEEHRPRGGKS
jgi:hypothetical protein